MTLPTPAQQLFMRRATFDDLATLARWRMESALEIQERERRLGLPSTGQWATPYARWKLERWIDRGVTWMASLDPYPLALPIATVTLDPEPEPAVLADNGEYTPLWTPDELATSAYYMSKLNRAPGSELRGVGETLVRWCQNQAAVAGAERVRADVWTGWWPASPDRQNKKLQDWYLKLGFRHVRTVPDVVSGFLIEIDAHLIPEISSRVCMAAAAAGPPSATEAEI